MVPGGVEFRPSQNAREVPSTQVGAQRTDANLGHRANTRLQRMGAFVIGVCHAARRGVRLFSPTRKTRLNALAKAPLEPHCAGRERKCGIPAQFLAEA